MPEPRPVSDRRRQPIPSRDAGARRTSSPKSRTAAPSDGAIATQPVLGARLHSGAITEVWRARRPGGGACAVKLPRPRWAMHAGAARLIEREREFLEQTAQPGIVATFGVVPMPAGPGLLLEYLPGGDLVALAGSHPRCWAEAARDVARTLEAVHERGIVHGDLKPRNVLLDGTGRATLIDFGSAARIGERRPASGGTAAYQSAAARRGARVDPADDLHAFAVMLYELLAGALPFGREPPAAVLETAPRSPLEERPALAGEARIAVLADLTAAALSAAPAEPRLLLGVFESTLQAIIAE